MTKRRIHRRTGFALGMAGAGMCLVAGVLVAFGFGQAWYVQLASFALSGAALLVLGYVESGPEKRALRAKLLCLFFVLLVAYMRLPLLDVIEAAVLPLTTALYFQKGDGPFIALLAVAEVLFAAVRTLALAPLFGAYPHFFVGGAMLLVGLARGAVMVRLYRRYADEDEDDG